MADGERKQCEGDDDSVLGGGGDLDAAYHDGLGAEDVEKEGDGEDCDESEYGGEVAEGEDGCEGESEEEVVVEVSLDVRRQTQAQLGEGRESEGGWREKGRPRTRRLQDELEAVLGAKA